MQKIKLFINVTISFLITLIGLLFFIKNSNYQFNFNDIYQYAYSGWKYLLLASLLLIISVYFRALRWSYLFNIQSRNSKLLLETQFIGYFINNILPIRVGDVGRSYIVAKKTNNTTSYILGSIVMERFLDIMMVLLLMFIVIYNKGVMYLDIDLSSTFFILCIIPLLAYLAYRSIIFIPLRIRNILNEIWKGFTDVKFSSKGVVVLYSFIIWGIYWLNVFLIQLIFYDFALSYMDCLLILVASSFLQMIPTGFGSLGIFHAGIQVVLNKLNIYNMSFIIILHLYSYILYTMLGAYYFFRESKFNLNNLYRDLIKDN